MLNSSFDLEMGSVEFAESAAQCCLSLPNDIAGQNYGDQYIRSAASVALDFEEMRGTNPIKELIYRAPDCLEEQKETRVNPRVLGKVVQR